MDKEIVLKKITELLEKFSKGLSKGEFEYITFDYLFLEMKSYLINKKQENLLEDKQFIKDFKKNITTYFKVNFIGFDFSKQIDEAFDIYFKII